LDAAIKEVRFFEAPCREGEGQVSGRVRLNKRPTPATPETIALRGPWCGKSIRRSRRIGGPRDYSGGDPEVQTLEAIVVEGEMDCLPMAVAGFQNVASVPNGAPATPQNGSSRRFEFLTNSAPYIEHVREMDHRDDDPGKILAHPAQQETDAGNDRLRGAEATP
jgi:hypothetical protein